MVLLLWWAGYLANIVLAPRAFTEFLAIEGVVIGLLKQAIIFFGYIPLVTEFFALVVTVHVVFPVQLWRREYPLDFSDVTGCGGFREVGDLLKRSTMLYFLGVLLYTVVTLSPVFITTEERQPTSSFPEVLLHCTTLALLNMRGPW